MTTTASGLRWFLIVGTSLWSVGCRRESPPRETAFRPPNHKGVTRRARQHKVLWHKHLQLARV